MNQPRTLGWRILRWGLVGLAVLVTLAAILVTEENWRGKRAWENYKRAADARGERLDTASVIPPQVPDDQNFFCAPIVANTLEWDRIKDSITNERDVEKLNDRIDFNIYRGDSKLWPTNGGNWRKGRLIDLAEWQHYFWNYNATPEGKTNGFKLPSQPGAPAADVLLALSQYDHQVEGLRAAASRPFARMPLNYEDGFESASILLPCLANTKRIGQFLQLRISAELEDNQPDKALDDIKLFLRVTDSISNSRFLISHLVRLAMLSIVLEPVYQGLTEHRWSDAQLAELERLLAGENLLVDYVSAMNGEKICAIDAFEKQQLTRQFKTMDNSSGTNQIVTVNLRWTPSAFFYQTELACAEMYDQFVLPLVNLTNRTISPSQLRHNETMMKDKMTSFSPYKTQALMLFPAVSKSVIKFAVIQTDLDLARVAGALERFRLAHGDYPESLDQLTPQFIAQLPHDIINGQPLQYHRAADNKYVLYSVGWNEVDDGGQVAFRKGGFTVSSENGDWVWKN